MKLNLIHVCTATVLFCNVTSGQEWKSGMEWQEPPVVTPGERNRDAPSDATVLFDGTNLSDWNSGDAWLIENGVAIPQKIDIYSKRHFGDIQLHLEWASPDIIKGEGQGRGNSGVFLMGLYEVQILDSYNNMTYFDGQSGSLYKQIPPMVNSMRKPGQWNTYDIFFTAPEFRTNGDVKSPGYITLMHNGVLVQNHFELLGPTRYIKAPHYETHAETGPIRLQFHHDAVRYRNIWVRELVPATGRRVRAPFNLPKQVEVEPADKENTENEDESENGTDGTDTNDS